MFDPASWLIVDVNRGAGRADWAATAEDLIGRRIGRPLPADRGGAARHDRRLLAAGDATRRPSMMPTIQRPNGDAIAVEVVLQPVELPGGGSRRSWPSPATSASGSRSRSGSSAWPSPSTPGRRSSTRSSGRWARRVVVCAADGTITLTNPAGEQIFPDVEEQTYDDILAPARTTRTGTPRRSGTPGGPVELPTRADPERWVEIATYPVTVGIGLATAGEETIVVMRDVTEARRREAVRETFIGVLSHELRTPVTTIFGGAKLLARERSTLDEETRRGIFRDIHEEAERLQRLVEDVVALNRFGEDEGEIGWEPVLLQRLRAAGRRVGGGALAGRRRSCSTSRPACRR